MNPTPQQQAEVINQAVDMATTQVFVASMLTIGVLLIWVAAILIACNRRLAGLILLALYGATTFVIPSVIATVAGVLVALTALIGIGAEFAFGRRTAGKVA